MSYEALSSVSNREAPRTDGSGGVREQTGHVRKFNLRGVRADSFGQP
jgi:hypothetical protein